MKMKSTPTYESQFVVLSPNDLKEFVPSETIAKAVDLVRSEVEKNGTEYYIVQVVGRVSKGQLQVEEFPR